MAIRGTGLKWALLAAIAAAVVAVGAVFLGYRQGFERRSDQLGGLAGDALMALGAIRQTATRDGRTEWSLEADTVAYRNERHQAVFTNVRLVFHTADGARVNVAAANGELNTETSDMRLTGGVTVAYDAIRLDTPALRYAHADRRIRSLAPVRISGGGFRLAADRLELDLTTRHTRMEGSVDAIFDLPMEAAPGAAGGGVLPGDPAAGGAPAGGPAPEGP